MLWSEGEAETLIHVIDIASAAFPEEQDGLVGDRAGMVLLSSSQAVWPGTTATPRVRPWSYRESMFFWTVPDGP